MNSSQAWHAFVAAVQFLTRLPVPGGMNRPEADRTVLRAAVAYFPLVGGMIGAFTGGVIELSLLLWPPVIAVVLGLIAEALLTGAFHEDAVADCCDAFGGGWTREDILRILKDSRVGSFGALGLTLMVSLRGGCLLAVPSGNMMATVAASAAVGRWAILMLMAFISPVPNHQGLAKDVGERIGWRELMVGAAFTLATAGASLVTRPLNGVVGLVAVATVTYAWGRYVRGRIGGVTGDCLGCGCYLGQCLFLLTAVAEAVR